MKETMEEKLLDIAIQKYGTDITNLRYKYYEEVGNSIWFETANLSTHCISELSLNCDVEILDNLNGKERIEYLKAIRESLKNNFQSLVF